MLRPERMSKVSVTGSKRVLSTVIETVHELNVVHLSDYDGSWEGFDNGDPIEGADPIAERLVTVRALESTLDLGDGEADPGELPADWEERLESVREEVTALDDRLSEHREELRQLEERIDRVAPFATLGIELDLLSGYDAVEVTVGEGDHEEIRSALSAAGAVRAFETFAEQDVVAIVAAPVEGETNVIDDALVGLEFAAVEVPDAAGDPESHLAELEDERAGLTAEIERIDEELESLAEEHGQFLRRVETELTIRLDRKEAPLQFATTKRAFVAEGWIPTEEVETFRAALESAVGDAVEIEELERAEYDRHGAVHHTESVEEEEPDEEAETEEPAAPKAATDGGTSAEAVTMDDEPPVVLNNLTPAKPFEMMVKMVNQPKYSELDPTLLVFLTFPFAFGFMIGDIGYGILYMAMGVGLWKAFDSDAGKALGTIAIWAGAFTILFGYLYDDIFGVHMADLGLALPLAGSLTKGLQAEEWALLWIVASILFGLVHLNLGLIMGFVNELRHGLKAAIFEKVSWILSLNGLFIWILSTHLMEHKPAFVVGPESTLYEFIGFAGFTEPVGQAALAITALGLVMVGYGEGAAGLAEWPAWAFGHALSYLRMVAVLLAKGGMAFVVNVLVFGSYVDETGYMAFNLPGYDVSGYEQDFVGLIHADPVFITIPAAILVFVLGHILVLVLGITAAGIQMLRLEYVEFFQKFYEGGGEEYDPFGTEAQPTAD